MVKKWGQRIYLAVIFLFLYLPILVLIVLSFNNSKSRVVWGGFTLKWYASCFTDETIMNAFVTTLQVTLTAAIVSTVIGTLAAIGISAMKKKNRTILLGATPMYAFYKVTWPEIKSGVFSGFLMAVTMSLDDFTITYFTKGAGIKTLSIIIYTERKLGNQPELYALSTIIFLIVLIVLFVVNRISIKKERSAVKRKNY